MDENEVFDETVEESEDEIFEWTIEEEIASIGKRMQKLDPKSPEYKTLLDRQKDLNAMLDTNLRRENARKAEKKKNKIEKKKIKAEKKKNKGDRKIHKKKIKAEKKSKEKEIEANRRNTRITVAATLGVGALSLVGTCLGIKATKNMHRDTLVFEETNVPPRSSSKSFLKRLF